MTRIEEIQGQALIAWQKYDYQGESLGMCGMCFEDGYLLGADKYQKDTIVKVMHLIRTKRINAETPNKDVLKAMEEML